MNFIKKNSIKKGRNGFAKTKLTKLDIFGFSFYFSLFFSGKMF
ncbi:hypothetical protein RIR_e33674_A0A2N1NZ65_9GLOM [Rhizophagus irregularis DAOM 181602=DAOM 197198]|nr:hypothetical protein RIR_e33674_A0A2N1NZ65_9GLOM [Rhizophagus irregularis DAOM 181602=DAOM 197198]